MDFVIGVYESRAVLVRVEADSLEEAISRVELLYNENVIFSDDFGTVIEHSIDDSTDLYSGLSDDEIQFECDFINLNKLDEGDDFDDDLEGFVEVNSTRAPRWDPMDDEDWDTYEEPATVKLPSELDGFLKLMGGRDENSD